jgi:hypothetical protein
MVQPRPAVNFGVVAEPMNVKLPLINVKLPEDRSLFNAGVVTIEVRHPFCKRVLPPPVEWRKSVGHGQLLAEERKRCLNIVLDVISEKKLSLVRVRADELDSTGQQVSTAMTTVMLGRAQSVERPVRHARINRGASRVNLEGPRSRWLSSFIWRTGAVGGGASSSRMKRAELRRLVAAYLADTVSWITRRRFRRCGRVR